MPYYAILCSTLLPTGLSSSAALCQRSFLGGAVGQRGWFPDDVNAKYNTTPQRPLRHNTGRD